MMQVSRCSAAHCTVIACTCPAENPVSFPNDCVCAAKCRENKVIVRHFDQCQDARTHYSCCGDVTKLGDNLRLPNVAAVLSGDAIMLFRPDAVGVDSGGV